MPAIVKVSCLGQYSNVLAKHIVMEDALQVFQTFGVVGMRTHPTSVTVLASNFLGRYLPRP